MMVTVVVMLATCVGLINFYLILWAKSACRKRKGSLYLATAAEPLLDGDFRDDGDEYVLVPCLKMHVYQEFFTLPWILMDTGWAVSNLMDTLKIKHHSAVLPFNIYAGIIAIAIEADCFRRRVSAREHREAASCLAELLWVAGNLVWMSEDLITGDTCTIARAVALGLFVIGAVTTIGEMCAGAWEERGCWLSAPPAIATPTQVEEPGQVAALVADASEVDLESNSFAETETRRDVCRVQADIDTVKKKRRAAHSKRPPRLTKGVTILRTVADDPLRQAARSLGGTAGPIAAVDLGCVAKRLQEWHARLPRVRPRHVVRCNSDKKVVQVLSESPVAGGCGFKCNTTSDVGLAVSCGVRPEDILFAEPRKLRSHLRYAKEQGVGLVSFQDEAELHFVRREFPTARLLLWIAPEEETSSPRPMSVRFGAARGQWAPLLALAMELGLSVVGVSVPSSQGGAGRGSFARALDDARQVFSIASERGFTMEVLDLGGDPAAATAPGPCALEDFAATVEAELDRCFPRGDFPELQVIAEPGEVLTEGAMTLVSPEPDKEDAAVAKTDEEGSFCSCDSAMQLPNDMVLLPNGSKARIWYYMHADAGHCSSEDY